MGGTIFVSAAQAVFANRLLQALATQAPSIDPHEILITGATELKGRFPGDLYRGVLESYIVGLKDAFLFGMVVAGCAFLSSWIAPIKSINQRRAPDQAE